MELNPSILVNNISNEGVMTLAEIRAKVVDLTGLRKLVTSTGADNGCNFFIQAATRELDRTLETSKDLTWYQEVFAAGVAQLDFNYCRFVSQVWYAGSDGSRTILTGKKFDELMSLYPKLQNSDHGTPLYWAPEPITEAPQTGLASVNLDRHGLIILPPTDQVITIYVYGKFYSLPLVNDTDENYWSVNHPDILVIATMRAIEVTSRNITGVEGYQRITDGLVSSVDSDAASWDAASRLVMEG